jgi:serine/threonine protein phosphatase PrpC
VALKGKVATALKTDVGRVRDNNEDALAEEPDIGLLVLADGMGGYNAGEIASGIAVVTVLQTVREAWPKLKKGRIDAATGFARETLLLRKALETAHETIWQAAHSQPQCAGMGTTAVACLLHDDRMSIAYVGDSRLYRQRDGRLEQITRDHTLAEELVSRGLYTRAEAAALVRRNIVTRALVVEPKV